MANKPKPRGREGGRKPGNPADVRSERIVLRAHPDLVDALTERGKVYGVSRSQFIERILITYLNLQQDQRPLDLTGRYVKTEAAARMMKQKPGDLWAAFGRRNLAMLGMRAEEAAERRRLAGEPPEERGGPDLDLSHLDD
jgi:hypothetical protein